MKSVALNKFAVEFDPYLRSIICLLIPVFYSIISTPICDIVHHHNRNVFLSNGNLLIAKAFRQIYSSSLYQVSVDTVRDLQKQQTHPVYNTTYPEIQF